MFRALLRLLLSLGGAALAAVFVAFLETRAVLAGVRDVGARETPSMGALVLNELGLMSPMAIAIGSVVGVTALLVQPKAAESPLRWLFELREGAVLDRLRAAAATPLVIFSVFGWCVVSAHFARLSMAIGKPAEAGITAGIGAIAALVVLGAIALACLPVVRRLLALGSGAIPALLDPVLTGSVALGIVVALGALGISRGDTSGAGGGALGIFGVLKRTELDLRPLANAGILALLAFIAPIVLTRAPRQSRPKASTLAAAALAVALEVGLFGLCVRASSHIGEPPSLVEGIEKHAPLGKIALAVLRRTTDRDKDGFSARFAGGDCNDNDKRVNPNALDIPGNGIDEDCSGSDTPAMVASATSTVNVDPPTVAKPERSFNVILITVDTLRPDLGFMGYGKPTSPNLDKLAEKATVFEHAYSMSSYTGKSVGPMLVGRYPSETHTNFNHFNTYFDANVMLAERARDAGYRTIGGMCHWYFRRSSGLAQGFDVWDVSAIPPGMSDNDTSISSERMADLALKLLRDPFAVTSKKAPGSAADGGTASADAGLAEREPSSDPERFFAWFHFFDPHAQYVAHDGAPDFLGKGLFAQARMLYDQEVWFTDKHIGRVLDYIASQPWAQDTAIVVTADHGEAFHEHGMMFHGSEIWNELVHVPLVVYVPGAAPRRVSVNRSHIDVAPTIVELMGLSAADFPELRGKSLLADVYLPTDGAHEERDVYIDMPPGPFNGVRRAIITSPSPGLKLIHSGGNHYQLFDLTTDPEEKKDLSSDKGLLREVIARMNAMRGRLQEIEVKPK
ncbi:MAG TPA: sulfatase-like hydrolase/transferase [Labilithrix sp.]|nr:sulfatase-like hydrolase/transferase [Labilithrix sp.]